MPPSWGHSTFQEADIYKYGAVAELQLGRENLRNLDKNLLQGLTVHHELQIQSPSPEPKASQWEDRVHLAELWHNLNKLQLQVSESTFMRVQVPELWLCRLTFRHHASSILGQAFHYSPENAFYIFNQQIYFISDICLTVHH